jgi:hypothetical protein
MMTETPIPASTESGCTGRMDDWEALARELCPVGLISCLPCWLFAGCWSRLVLRLRWR